MLAHLVSAPIWHEGLQATQSHPKATPRPPQGHILGIDSEVQGHPKATPRPPQGHPKATPRLLQGYTKATPRLQQSHPKASPKPPQSHPHAPPMRPQSPRIQVLASLHLRAFALVPWSFSGLQLPAFAVLGADVAVGLRKVRDLEVGG